jgi:hypothetical protein
MTPRVSMFDRNGRDGPGEWGREDQAPGEPACSAALRGPTAVRMRDHRITVVARSVFADRSTFKYPIMLGLIHPLVRCKARSR